MTFLPKDYELPKAGGGSYTRLQPGINKIRILSSPITGYLRWEEKKPLRTQSRMTPEDRHFWAVKVYNYNTKSIEVWEFTQVSIQEALVNLSQGSWGDPREYPIEITKTGQDKETRYQVMPLQKAALEPEVEQLSKDTHVNLAALWDGGDCFAQEDDLPFSI